MHFSKDQWKMAIIMLLVEINTMRLLWGVLNTVGTSTSKSAGMHFSSL